MIIDWADIDMLTSKSIAMISFLVYLYMYIRF